MVRTVRKKNLVLYIAVLLLFPLLGGLFARGAESAAEVKVPAAQAVEVDALIAEARAEVKASPSDAAALLRLGDLLVRKGSLDEALTCFDRALVLNPRAHEAKTGKGVVLARKGSYQEAEAVLLDALRLNPNPVRTHYELGLVYEKLGDLEKAMAQFKEGIMKHEQGR